MTEKQNDVVEPDFSEWAFNLRRKGSSVFYSDGWDGVEKMISDALKQAYEQGYYLGSREE